MPANLTTREEVELWLTVPSNEALRPQRPLPNTVLQIVARGKKEDGPHGIEDGERRESTHCGHSRQANEARGISKCRTFPRPFAPKNKTPCRALTLMQAPP
jgi:hypothetical protein